MGGTDSLGDQEKESAFYHDYLASSSFLEERGLQCTSVVTSSLKPTNWEALGWGCQGESGSDAWHEREEH